MRGVFGGALWPHDLVEVADEAGDAADDHDHQHRPQGCAEGEDAHHHDAERQPHGDVVAIDDVEARHDTSLATKTKNSKAPRNIPKRKPYPSPWLIRRASESGLLGMNTATAAGSPEQST